MIRRRVSIEYCLKYQRDLVASLGRVDDWIRPLTVEHEQWLIDYATRFNLTIFRESFRQEIRRRFTDRGLKMIEAAVRYSKVDDPADFNGLRADVARLARRSGTKLHSVGKRPRAELDTLVKEVAPVLVHLGLPLACGNYSPLVETLKGICQQLGLEGDPRHVLRRIRRMETAQTHFAYALMLETAIEALRPDEE